MNLKNLALAILAAAVAVLSWLQFLPDDPPPGVHVEAQLAPQVRAVERESVPAKQVQAYRPAAKKRLKLPQPVQADPDQHVVAATRTPADERAHTVTSVLDTSTGEVTTYDRAEPLPWLAASSRTEAGVFYGYKDGEPALRVEARQELLQVKALRLGATASADVTAGGDLDTFVGVGVWARW